MEQIFSSGLYSDERNSGYCTLSANRGLEMDLPSAHYQYKLRKIRVYYEKSHPKMSLSAELRIQYSSGSTYNLPLKIQCPVTGIADFFPGYNDKEFSASGYYFELKPKQSLGLFNFGAKDYLCLQQVELFWEN
ncbi:MAG: hypothetical protein PHO85_00135 [Candidatus Cloacimonetes bacterium]|nr:hypothetical protein [Candidatus Cloacimonadota bacterium]